MGNVGDVLIPVVEVENFYNCPKHGDIAHRHVKSDPDPRYKDYIPGSLVCRHCGSRVREICRGTQAGCRIKPTTTWCAYHRCNTRRRWRLQR